MNNSDTVSVKVSLQGEPVVGPEGYMKVAGEKVVAFYLDGGGKTGRAYPLSSSSQTHLDNKLHNLPCITVENGEPDSDITEIYFPEYEGWNVFAVRGGKTMSICLVDHR